MIERCKAKYNNRRCCRPVHQKDVRHLIASATPTIETFEKVALAWFVPVSAAKQYARRGVENRSSVERLITLLRVSINHMELVGDGRYAALRLPGESEPSGAEA